LALGRDLQIPRHCAEALEGLAEVATSERQLERAVRLFGAARATRDRIGHPLYARYRERHEQTFAAIRAALGDAAFAAAWETGRAMPLDEAIAEALTIGTSSRIHPSCAFPPATPSHPLSPRELDVLRGIVAGHSNAEIASALFISPNTVSNHVTNIMNKLGLESRTAVATWAVRNGVG
jgi:DNA-binding NarL/FixJ family response regulator